MVIQLRRRRNFSMSARVGAEIMSVFELPTTTIDFILTPDLDL
jgi:hypothetical protein